jgi:3-ketosteroid 9alpha-monooxygenase subunit A
MLQDLESTEEFRFARGWFVVAPAVDVTAEAPLRLFFFDRKMVAFRGLDGKVAVLDGVCPHMAAEFAVEGAIVEGSVRCPYHHWRFGPDGKCNHIPYSNAIPPQAKVHSYPVREVNGCVLVWYDPEFGDPDFEVPEIAEIDDPQWVPWDVVRMDVRTIPMEVIDNIADYGHFEPTHHCAIKSFAVKFDGYKAIQSASMSHETLADEPGGTMNTVATYYGPGYFVTEIDALYDSKMLLSTTPVDDNNVAIWFGQMVKANGEVTPEFM